MEATAHAFCYRANPAIYSNVEMTVDSGADAGIIDIQGDMRISVTYSVTGDSPDACYPTLLAGSFEEWEVVQLNTSGGTLELEVPRSVQDIQFGVDCSYPNDMGIVGAGEDNVTLAVGYRLGTTAPDGSGVIAKVYASGDPIDDPLYGVVYEPDGKGLLALVVREGASIGVAPWGCIGTEIVRNPLTPDFVPGVVAPNWYGLTYSQNIVDQCSERPIAASVALDYVSPDGADDWYLPAWKELGYAFNVLETGTYYWTARQGLNSNQADAAFAMKAASNEFLDVPKTDMRPVVPVRRVSLPINP